MEHYLFLIIFLVLLLFKMPVAFSLGLSCLSYFLMNGVPIQTMPQIMLGASNSFTLLAIPLFMLAGFVMSSGGVAKRLFDFCLKLVGHIPGGLGHVDVVSNLIFAGMSGSCTADAAGLGMLEIDYMKKEGYDPAFCAALTAASSTMGSVMPPSLGLVIFGSMTGASIGALFMAGILPALLMCGVMMLTVYLKAKKEHFKVYPRATFSVIFAAFLAALLPMLTPIIILAGITTGFTTPTEAAILAVVYAILLAIFLYKELTWRQLKKMFVEVGKLTSGIMLIIAFATLFGWILSYEGIPLKVAKALTQLTGSKVLILLIINAMLLVMGCFMEGISIMLIVIPVLLPLLTALGVNLIQFGVVMELNLNIGLITPPLGVVAFVCANIAKVSFERTVKASVPFIAALVAVLMMITYIPDITLILPRLFGFKV